MRTVSGIEVVRTVMRAMRAHRLVRRPVLMLYRINVEMRESELQTASAADDVSKVPGVKQDYGVHTCGGQYAYA